MARAATFNVTDYGVQASKPTHGTKGIVTPAKTTRPSPSCAM